MSLVERNAPTSKLDKMEGKDDCLAFICKVFQNNGTCVSNVDLATIKIHSARDANTFENENSQTFRPISFTTCSSKKGI